MSVKAWTSVFIIYAGIAVVALTVLMFAEGWA